MLRIIWRCIRRKCPRCGGGPLFHGWGTVRHQCDACGLDLHNREPDTWMVMYVSTAFITGLFIAAMLWVFPAPQNKWAWRAVLGIAAMVALFGTAPLRKGLAIAFDYWIDERDGQQRAG